MQTQDRRAHVAGDEEVTAAPPRRRRTAPGVAVAVAVVVLLATGVLVWGRVAPTEMIAMALTGGWFLAVLGAAAIVARRRRHLAVPLAIGYGLSAVTAFVLLGLPQLRDTTVDEQVATVDSVPAAQADEPASGGDAAADPAADAPDDSADAPDEPDGADAADADAQEDQPDADAPAGNTAAVTGTFVDLVHPGAGTATVVELADGGRVLTLTGFETDPGPDLRVYLTAQDPADGGEIGEFIDLGALKGNVGDQQYEIPDDVDIETLSTAVVWCRAFSIGFTSAALTAP